MTPPSSLPATWLVTGATGFLGAALVDRLLTLQALHATARPGPAESAESVQSIPPLRLLVREGSRRDRLDAVLARHPGAAVQVVAGSLASVEAAADLLSGVGTVCHLAASMSGRTAEIFAATVGSTRHLLDAMVASSPADATAPAPRPRLLLVSSFGVYGTAEMEAGAVLDENTPLETSPARRDPYSHAKLAQEALAQSYRRRHGLGLTILRPGVIYGPGGPALSARIGLALGPLYLHLGGRNLLPLTYVDNCADAIVTLAQRARFEGEAFNAVDDESIDAAAFLGRYRREVRALRVLSLPWPAVQVLARAVAWCHRVSRGRFPLLMTPYRARATWRPQRFANAALHGLGWSARIGLQEGLSRTFAALRAKATPLQR